MPIVVPERTNSGTGALAAIAAATTLDELKAACQVLARAVDRVEVATTDPALKPPVSAVPVDGGVVVDTPVVADEPVIP